MCGPFKLVEKIGQGGMGEIWRGRHVNLGVEVAVKLVGGLAQAEERKRRLFRSEVRAHAGLTHPGIVEVLDFGEVDEKAEAASQGRLVSGSPYLVIEYAPGGTLRDLPALDDWSRVCSVLIQILEALAFAHARGVIHRDLKPENILYFPHVHGPGMLKLADFGIAHAVGYEGRTQGEGQKNESIAASAGSPHYMAPEQWRGQWRRFGPWTDLYQVGAMAWELICGRPPFEAGNVMALGPTHVTKPMPPLEPLFEVPAALDGWIARMSAKRPETRFRQAADAAWNLRQLGQIDEPPGPAPTNAGEPAKAEETGKRDQQADVDAGAVTQGMEFAETLRLFDANEAIESTPVNSPHSKVSQDSSEGSDSVGAYQIPPVPGTWKSPSVQRSQIPLKDAGLGLFGLREIPFVDRDDERDIVWNAVKRAIDGKLQGVLIEGPGGVGKSRLAQWISRRAHEVGACQIMSAFHNPQGSGNDGLLGMLEDYMGTWHLERDEVYELLLARVQAEFAISKGDLSPERDAAAMTELLRPTTDWDVDNRDVDRRAPRYRFAAKTEKFALLYRMLHYAASRRPALVWLDDVHWAGDALGWLEFIYERNAPMGAVFVLTAQTGEDLLPAEEAALARARKIASRANMERITLSALPQKDHTLFISRTLTLEPDLAGMVAECTSGNPLFAIQLIGDWVERGKLTPGPRGFGLAHGKSDVVPDAIRVLWDRRIQYLIEALPPDDRQPARRGLELAAALGREVHSDEWTRACAHAGIRPVDRLQERLVETGLATSRPGRWRFVHESLVEILKESAQAAGRWPSFHVACAEMLAEGTNGTSIYDLARRAEHLVRAEQTEAALEPLSDAVEAAIRRVDMDLAATLNDRQRQLFDLLGLAEDDARRAHNHLDRAEITLTQNPRKSQAITEDLAPYFASHNDDAHGRVRLLLIQAKLSLQLGQLDEGKRKLQEARDLAGELPKELQARIVRGLGHAARYEGDYELAVKYFKLSRDLYAQARMPSPTLQVESDIIYVATELGDYEGARRESLPLLEESRRQGDAHAEVQFLNCLGDAAQHLAEWDDACRYFSQALGVTRQTGNRAGEAVQLLNLGLSYLGKGDFLAARHYLKSSDLLFEDLDTTRLTPLVAAGLAACAVGRGDISLFEAELARAEEALSSTEFRSTNQAWTLGLAAQKAMEAGRPDEGRRLLRVERRVWQALQRWEQTARIDEILA